MTTITITGKQPGKTDVTISSTVNPAVKTVVPVTVLSRNLLSYGPASGNGLTATVNSDGSLHVKGTASSQWAGIRWTFPCPVHGAVTLSRTTSIDGLTVSVKCLDAKGDQPGDQINTGSAGTIPAGTVSLRFEILSNEATPTEKNGDLRVQLESGDTAHDWMKPDNTSLGGGYELANLWPAIPGETKNGVTLTASEDGSYTATGEATDWTAWASSITLHPGDYYLVPNITGTGINVAMLDPAGNASNQQTGAFTVASTETWAARIFTTAATGPVNATVTPRLYKID
ncbi:hypothetical protein [Bifidobacterium longum]|uniref:hypothetical protein n=1 Tax=Bifidobacterium longum TaxID=216816 RepID=UPI0010DA9AF6|nr:hypothetical protein [Bifidobacterium longum]TCE26378.1 hypothetical protein MCC10034_0335 [Bifidobacterium longum subsp. longum]